MKHAPPKKRQKHKNQRQEEAREDNYIMVACMVYIRPTLRVLSEIPAATIFHSFSVYFGKKLLNEAASRVRESV